MTIPSAFIVGGVCGFAIGLIVGCLCSSAGSPPYLIGRPPVPRQQKKPRANEGTIFSTRIVRGGIH